MWSGRLAWAGGTYSPAPAMPRLPLATTASDLRALCNHHAQVQVKNPRATTPHVRGHHSSH